MKTRFIFFFIAVISAAQLFAVSPFEDPDVYITKSGTKYHYAGCSYLNGSAIKKKLSEVGGYSLCSRCAKKGSPNITTPSPTKQDFSNSGSSDEAKEKPRQEAKPEAPSGTTKSGATIYTGPRGGKYHYSKSGKKVYEKK